MCNVLTIICVYNIYVYVIWSISYSIVYYQQSIFIFLQLKNEKRFTHGLV